MVKSKKSSRRSRKPCAEGKVRMSASGRCVSRSTLMKKARSLKSKLLEEGGKMMKKSSRRHNTPEFNFVPEDLISYDSCQCSQSLCSADDILNIN